MRVLLLILLALPACTLIDQRTFDPDAGKAPVIPPAPTPVAVRPPPPGPPALLTIDMARLDPDALSSALAKAVTAARARKPTVAFDVVAIIPPGAEPGPATGADAAAIARLIEGNGVPASRIDLIARPEAGAAPREVRVYVQ